MAGSRRSRLNLLTNAITAAANGEPPRQVTVWTAVGAARHVELGVHDSGNGIGARGWR
jgi:C4-dicarboxylate-specific signal transduction histidine kinase